MILGRSSTLHLNSELRGSGLDFKVLRHHEIHRYAPERGAFLFEEEIEEDLANIVLGI